MSAISQGEQAQIQAYLQTTFGNQGLHVKARPQASDSVEVWLNDEFLGVIYKDEEDGEIAYDFNMAILSGDLPGVAG